ncbi:MAG: sugar transporter, partial [Polaribacter sp.]
MDNKTKFTTNAVSSSVPSIDFKGYLYKVLAYWKLFLVSFTIAFIIAKFMNGYKQRIYSLDTIISVKEQNNPLFSTGTNIAFNWGGSSDEVETIRVILISRSHNEKVVKKLKFYIQYLKEGKYRMNDVFGYTPFEVILKNDAPQLFNKNIEVLITGENTYKLSIDFNESGNNALINYKTNTV